MSLVDVKHDVKKIVCHLTYWYRIFYALLVFKLDVEFRWEFNVQCIRK